MGYKLHSETTFKIGKKIKEIICMNFIHAFTTVKGLMLSS